MGALEARVVAQPWAARAWRTAAAYVSLTKPRIVTLLLVTTIPAMVLANGGWPSTWLVVATVVGGTLAAGGANAINCFYDRDIDALMHRTHGRPLPAGRVEPAHALVFAVALEVAAFVMLAASSNLLAAGLALAATAFYVFVYTMWLKRTTSQNIVIGGAAGAVPPLVGWAAVTGSLGLAPLVLFAIIFLWTPPHFWALSIKYREDYARASVPMLPVVATLEQTKSQILWYTVVLVAMSLLLVPAGAGWIYAVAAVLLGAGFIREAWLLHREEGAGRAMDVFRFSITYLGLLFVAVALDALVLP
jgi:protoheme IX farnesyltransferase